MSERIQALEEELMDLRDSVDAQKESVRSIQQKTVGIGDTSIGGYGELNWANFDGTKKDEFDVQRFIMFLGHKFSDRTRMMSEIEFEHAQVKGGEDGGENHQSHSCKEDDKEVMKPDEFMKTSLIKMNERMEIIEEQIQKIQNVIDE